MMRLVLLLICLVPTILCAPQRTITKRCGFLQPLSCTSVQRIILQQMVNEGITSNENGECLPSCMEHLRTIEPSRSDLCDSLCADMQHYISMFNIVEGGSVFPFGK